MRAPGTGKAVARSAATVLPSEWGVESIDLASYLRRIRDAGPLDPTAATLRRLHWAHATAISFENLDIRLGRDIALGLPELQDKLVHRRRGGYCHEQNLLFAAVLERLGFGVTRLLARPSTPSQTVLPRAHATLLIQAEAQVWLADVGYGGDGPLEPLPLRTGVVSRQGGWIYRLRHDGQEFAIQMRRASGWVDLYSFALAGYRPPDFEVANYHASTHPSSPFTADVVVQRTTDDARYAMRGRELVVTYSDGASTRRPVADEELPHVLRGTFGIELDDEELRSLAVAQRRTPS